MGLATRFPGGMSVPGPSQDTRLPLSSREDAHPDPNRYASFPADKPFCINDTDAARIIDADGEEARTTSPSSARILAIKKRRNRRAYIEAVGNVAGSVPRWISRRHWLEDVSSWAYCDGAQLLCRRVAPVTFLAVTAVLAEFADSADGRHCAVTNRVVALRANCSERTVSTVRSVLAAAEFALLAKQGSGGGGRPNRVAVWHLVSRRQPVDNSGVCALPPSRRDRGSSLVRRNKPTRTRAKKTPSKSKRRPATSRRTTPRPLAMQRLAAELVGRMHGMAGGHIGAICDALAAAGVDPAVSTARQICRHLDADMRETGWSWPNEVQRPGAFLAYRLQRIAGRLAAANPEPAGVAADRHQEEPEADPLIPRSSTERHTVAEDSCSVCGVESAVRRPWLPARRAHICDPCWTVAGREEPTMAAAVAGSGL